MTKKYSVSLPSLHEKQMEVYRSKAKYKIVNCGRRFGKTLLASRLIVEKALHGKEVAIILPTYNMSTTLWRKINADLHMFQSHPNFWKTEQNRVIVLPTGGIISFFSSDKQGDKLRGQRFHFAVIDEAAMVPDLQDLWEAALGPTLADFDGEALFISTPRGAGDYFHKLYKMGLDNEFPDYESFHYTSYDNPFIKSKVIDNFKQMVPARVFEQEYLAEFADDVGEVFQHVTKIATGIKHEEPYSGAFVMGADFGRKNDYTVVTVIDIETHTMVDFLRMTSVSYKEQMRRINEFYRKWKPDLMICESNSFGSANIEMLRDEYDIPVQSFYTTNKSKKAIIDLLAKDIEQQNITLINNRQLISELQSYRVDILPSGNLRFNAPRGMHDDFVISIALANSLVQNSKGTFGSYLPKLPGWGIRRVAFA